VLNFFADIRACRSEPIGSQRRKHRGRQAVSLRKKTWLAIKRGAVTPLLADLAAWGKKKFGLGKKLPVEDDKTLIVFATEVLVLGDRESVSFLSSTMPKIMVRD